MKSAHLSGPSLVPIGRALAFVTTFKNDQARSMSWPTATDRGEMDADLDGMERAALIAEVKRLRAGIRTHRDSSGHALCWHHPQLWGLLPEKIAPEVAVPPWPNFIRGCLAYREALDRELPAAPIADIEYGK
jgi:hypothetical protein